MYRKDRLSREVLLISNNIATSLLLNISADGNNLYDHIALFIFPTVMKLIILNIRHKVMVTTVEAMLRHILAFIHSDTPNLY